MNARVVSVIAVAFGAALLGGACSSSSSQQAIDDDGGATCRFVQDTSNCWRRFAAKVDDCLADEKASSGGLFLPVTIDGALTADHRTCTYPSGRVITFAKDPTNADDKADRDFTVTYGGKRCLHMVTSDGMMSMIFDGPDGAQATFVNGLLTCPDKTQHPINPLALFKQCGGTLFDGIDSLPGVATQVVAKPDVTTTSLHLGAQTKWAYVCTTGPLLSGDAGSDVGP